MRVLLALATALMLAVALASAALRLAGNDVGCSPWPACQSARALHGDAAPAAIAQPPAWQRGVRLTHRISASLAGLLFIWLVGFGWARWSASERIAGATLLIVAALLAWLGRFTPSPLPAVALANMFGGFVLLAALFWLLWPQRLATVAHGTYGGGVGLLALVVLQTALGALVGARAAAGACLSGCGWGWPDSVPLAAMLDPWVSNASPALAANWEAGRQALLQLHTWGAAIVLLAVLLFIGRSRVHTLAAWSMLALAALGALLGIWMRNAAAPLWVAIAHNMLAGITLVAAVVGLRRRQG